jgi:hypothetical protein
MKPNSKLQNPQNPDLHLETEENILERKYKQIAYLMMSIWGALQKNNMNWTNKKRRIGKQMGGGSRAQTWKSEKEDGNVTWKLWQGQWTEKRTI